MADDRQPRRPGAAAGFGGGMCCQDAPDDILIDLDTEGVGDLLGNPRAAETRIAPFQLDNGVDQFLRRSFGTRFGPVAGREKPMILALEQCRVESEQGGRPQDEGSPEQPPSAEKQRPQTEQQSIQG